jgi:hypothetical protein
MAQYNPAVTGGQFRSPSGVSGTNSEAQTLSFYQTPYPQQMELKMRYKSAIGLRDLIRTWGYSRGSDTATTGHFEKGREIEHFVKGAFVSGTGQGTDVIVATDTTGMYTVAGVNYSYPIKNELLIFPNGEQALITLKNTATNPHRFTLRPTNSNFDLGTYIQTLPDGTPIMISTSVYADGDGYGEGRVPLIIDYENEFQIIKENNRRSGTSLVTSTYFTFEGEQNINVVADWDMERRFKLKCDNALLFGKANTNTLTTLDSNNFVNTSQTMTTTQGMIDWIEQFGYEDNIVAGFRTVQDFDNITNILTRDLALSNEYMVLQGINAYQDYEDVLIDYGTQKVTGATIDMNTGSEMGPNSIKIDTGAWGLKKSGFTYMFKQLDALNDNKGAGTAGYSYPEYSIFCPMGMYKDPSTGTEKPTIGYEYRASEYGGSREEFVTNLDGTQRANGATTIEQDGQLFGVTSHIAWHGCAPNNFVIQKP